MTLALRYAARSDVGLVRANNQDSGYAGPNLLVVADGMGGHAGGDVASAIAVASLVTLDSGVHSAEGALDELRTAIQDARRRIVEATAANPELEGMGTTVTAVVLTDDGLALGHMGDSRAYLLRDGELSQVTVDHTFVQYLVDTGKISPEEAEYHPQRSVVMRVVGDFELEFEPDLLVVDVVPGDRLLLCSDGLSGYVSLDLIGDALAGDDDPASCTERLVRLALDAGGPDNVTCIVVDVVDVAEPGVGTVVEVVGSAEEDWPDDADAEADHEARARGFLENATARPLHGRPEADVEPGDAEPGDADAPVADPAASAATLPPPPPAPETVPIQRVEPAVPVRDAGTRPAAQDVDEPAAEPLDDAPAPDPAEADGTRSRRRRRRLVLTVVVLAVLGAGSWLAYDWTQQNYYVGISDGRVAVFRGIPQTVGPLSFSEPVDTTDIPVSDLPGFVVTSLEGSIQASSREEARRLAQNLGSYVDQDAATSRSGE